jgi:hypothetical protein
MFGDGSSFAMVPIQSAWWTEKCPARFLVPRILLICMGFLKLTARQELKISGMIVESAIYLSTRE